MGYQKVKNDQPTIDSFLSQVEDDDEFPHSVAAESGIKDFISPLKPNSTQNYYDFQNNNNNNNNNSNDQSNDNKRSISRSSSNNSLTSISEVTSARQKNSRRLSPPKPFPLQRNTLDKYFSPTKPESASSSSGATPDAGG